MSIYIKTALTSDLHTIYTLKYDILKVEKLLNIPIRVLFLDKNNFHKELKVSTADNFLKVLAFSSEIFENLWVKMTKFQTPN